MKELQQYTYTIPANGSVQIPAANDNFIIQASTGALAVRGNTFGRLRGVVAGQGLKNVPFDRLELFDESGAPNTVTLLMTPAEFVNQTFSGSVTVVSGVLTDAQLRAAPVPVRIGELAQAWGNFSTDAANTAVNVFTAAANVNGAVILSAQASTIHAGFSVGSFLAKATAPANVLDGEIVAQSNGGSFGGSYYNAVDMQAPQRIAAGLGLWFITNAAATANGLRSARFILL